MDEVATSVIHRKQDPLQLKQLKKAQPIVFTSEPASAGLSQDEDRFESSETLFSKRRKHATTLHPSVALRLVFYVEQTLRGDNLLPHILHTRSIHSEDTGVLLHDGMERVQGECREGSEPRAVETSELD